MKIMTLINDSLKKTGKDHMYEYDEFTKNLRRFECGYRKQGSELMVVGGIWEAFQYFLYVLWLMQRLRSSNLAKQPDFHHLSTWILPQSGENLY